MTRLFHVSRFNSIGRRFGCSSELKVFYNFPKKEKQIYLVSNCPPGDEIHLKIAHVILPSTHLKSILIYFKHQFSILSNNRNVAHTLKM